MFTINDCIGGILINANFKDKVCILKGGSGDGKTLLFSKLQFYYDDKGIPVALLNSSSFSNSEILSIRQGTCDIDHIYLKTLNASSGAKVILLDNADLYLTTDILNEMKTFGELIVISIKDFLKLQLDVNACGFYKVVYENMCVKVLEC